MKQKKKIKLVKQQMEQFQLANSGALEEEAFIKNLQANKCISSKSHDPDIFNKKKVLKSSHTNIFINTKIRQKKKLN